MDLKEYYMNLPYDLSGSRSKNRFRIELLWGIDKMLDLMETDSNFVMVFDYVCDIEVHLSDGFEFYQLKTHKMKSNSYNVKKLTNIKTDNAEGSILGKLYVLKTMLNEKVKLAIVTNVPYSFEKKKVEYICFDELPELEKEKIIEKLKEELNVDDVDLSQIFYICTDMNLKNPENAIQGKLVISFMKIIGSEVERPCALYNLIYNEVSEKACYEMRNNTYESVVKNKGITRKDFECMLKSHSNAEKTGVKQAMEYVDGIKSISERRKYKGAISKIINGMDISKKLKENESIISKYLVRAEAKNEDLGAMDDLIKNMHDKFDGCFPIEYSDEEKSAFYLVVVCRFLEGYYDENDI